MDLVDVTVYYLEMLAPVQRSAPKPRDGVTVLHVKSPSVPYYRFLYNAVGADYQWLSRRDITDEELADIICHPLNDVFVLHVDGSPAGFADFNRREAGEIEMVQFGLIGDFIGQGLGKWFLHWTIDQAWSYQPSRFWLHTCTLDHPAALPNYEKAGFVAYKTEEIQRKL